MLGIVLKTIPYQENGRIVTLFTDTSGVISLFIKRLSIKNLHLQNVTSPLSLSEFQLEKRKSDLYFFQDATLLDPFLEIRRDLDRLTATQKLFGLILKSQPPEKPAPLLFLLLLNYLKAVKTTMAPKNYALSFMTKILRHEGLFPHVQEDTHFRFEHKEWESMQSLARASSHKELSEITPPAKLEEKIYAMFLDLIT